MEVRSALKFWPISSEPMTVPVVIADQAAVGLVRESSCAMPVMSSG